MSDQIETIETADPNEQWRKRMGVGQRQYLYGRHVGTTKTVPERREDNGKIGGAHHHHWDGSVSATVRPDTIRVKAGMRYYDQ